VPELGRSTTAYVSGYERAAVHDSRLRTQESRQLTANFNGALLPGALITQADWQIAVPYWVVMASPAISSDRRSTSIHITAGWPGEAWIRCQVTADNGDRFAQHFRIAVYGPGPIFGDLSPEGGPAQLTVTAP